MADAAPHLVHDVYFTLEDASSAARDRLVAACHQYLTGHEGTVAFGVGTLAGEFDRPVNDRDWHVALHLVFADRAAHDRYQEAPRHKAFMAEQRPNWKKVRVFDAWIAAVR